MNENKLTFINEEGQEVLCTVLFTFTSDEFGKDYVVFYADSEDDEEQVELMAASYTLNEDGTVKELSEITTDEEWELVEEVLEEFDSQCECDCEECNHEDCDCEDEECSCGCGCHHHHE